MFQNGIGLKIDNIYIFASFQRSFFFMRVQIADFLNENFYLNLV